MQKWSDGAGVQKASVEGSFGFDLGGFDLGGSGYLGFEFAAREI